MRGWRYVRGGSSSPTSKGLSLYLGGANGLRVSCLQLLQCLTKVLS